MSNKFGTRGAIYKEGGKVIITLTDSYQSECWEKYEINSEEFDKAMKKLLEVFKGPPAFCEVSMLEERTRASSIEYLQLVFSIKPITLKRLFPNEGAIQLVELSLSIIKISNRGSITETDAVRIYDNPRFIREKIEYWTNL